MHISEARLRVGLTYKRMTQVTGWPITKVRGICTGRQRPSNAERQQLAAVVGQPAEQVSYGKQPESTKRRKGRFHRDGSPATPGPSRYAEEAEVAESPRHASIYQEPEEAPPEVNGRHLDAAGVEALEAGVVAVPAGAASRRLIAAVVVRELPNNLVVVDVLGVRFLAWDLGGTGQVEPIVTVEALAGIEG